jgi:beta-galactosidase
LVWYGLYPLPLGLKDTSRPPELHDGIFFPVHVEGQPGVQPKRLGPYCSTLNPGYDPGLPLFRKWPLYEAIQDGSAEPPTPGKWSKPPAPVPPQTIPAPAPVVSANVIGGPSSELAAQLKNIGVPFDQLSTQQIPHVLFVDGIHPPGAASRELVENVLRNGGTVLVWGADSKSIVQLSALLPAPLSVVDRTASSLLPAVAGPLNGGLKPSNLYFCNQRPPDITHVALAGPLITQSTILLKDCGTDWLKWNNQPEYAKTAMVLRSELEAKPSGVVLAEKSIGKGRLLLTTLSSIPASIKEENVVRQILANMGFQLQAGMDSGKPLLRTGQLVRALACGFFPAAKEDNPPNPAPGNASVPNTLTDSAQWQKIFNENGSFNIAGLGLQGSPDHAEAYLSFWVSSPRSLVDLLLEPDLPQVDLHISHRGGMQIWLNDQPLAPSAEIGGTATYAGLKLHESWNHFLVRVGHTEGAWQFEARFSANQPGFIAQLDSALKRP